MFKGNNIPFQLLFCLGLLAALALNPNIWAAEYSDAGLLFDEFDLTLNRGSRTEVAGPLFYRQKKESELTLAVPPLFSKTTDPETESLEFDFAYPIMTYDRYGEEFRWQLLQLISLSGGQTQAEVPSKRFTIFPLYFQQRSPDKERNYTALVPLYGHLQHRLFRDEIFFVLFPLYSQTRKRDVITDNYLYPIFHLRHGDSLKGWQFWPLVGSEHKGITTRTNGFGEVETVGGHDKFFALWPIYFNQLTGIGTDNPQKTLAVLPMFSVQRSPERDSTAVIWPLFNVVDDRKKKYREWQTPWPLIIFARGEGKTTSRVFPLFSDARNDSLESIFFLWPIYKYKRMHTTILDRERTRILFFLYSDTVQKNLETGEARRRVDFWPFFTHKRDYNGNSRLQIFAPLEPILPASESIERNYSPLWSVWRYEKNPTTRETSQSFLWNLYRRESGKDHKKCSLLFGLFQYQSTTEGKRLKLFYVPVINGKKQEKGKPEPESGPGR
jgi:hypothetical protein